MYICEKELALNQLLNKILLLEEEIEGVIVSYYIPTPLKINGRVVHMSLYELIQSIIHDYENIVLEDYYKELNQL